MVEVDLRLTQRRPLLVDLACADLSMASATRSCAWAEPMPAASDCSLALAESICATAESCAAWEESRSLLAISSLRNSSLLRSKSRLVSTSATWALAVLAFASASAARAFSTSARAFSTCAAWLRTVAWAASRSALAWLTLASKISGSIRAMTWSFLTTVLKSAKSSLICPETWLPTWTVVTALRLPVAETAAVRGPRSIFGRPVLGGVAAALGVEVARDPARDQQDDHDEPEDATHVSSTVPAVETISPRDSYRRPTARSRLDRAIR